MKIPATSVFWVGGRREDAPVDFHYPSTEHGTNKGSLQGPLEISELELPTRDKVVNVVPKRQVVVPVQTALWTTDRRPPQKHVAS